MIYEKKPRKSSACGRNAIICRIFRAFSYFSCTDPRGPNFAEIHARGRRGRLEYDHRDLIPPWGHGLLHGEKGKPTMPVCFDRNEGALPSRRTEMVGKDSGGTAGQCSTTDSRSSRHSGSMQQKKRAQQHRAALLPRLPGQSHVPGCRFSGQNRLRLGLHPGSNWRRLAAFRGKRGVCVGKRRRCRACKG